MKIYYCRDGCCTVKIKNYNARPRYFTRNYRKAGVLIYDPLSERVLLVQSCGHLWGPPKGTLKIDELERECAVREVKEETGLDISYDSFSQSVNIKNNAIYYYLEMGAGDVNVQEHENEEHNDANGITWIKLSCLENAIIDGNIVLNHYAKIAFKSLLKKTFSRPTWTLVNRR